MNCTWVINAPRNQVVRFKFEMLELEFSARCLYDFVKIYDGPIINQSRILGTFCGNLTEDLFHKILSKSNTMTVQFVTDWSIQHSGFKGVLDFTIGPSQGCGGKIYLNTSTPQILQSPDFDHDGKYESYLDCHWFIFATDFHNVEINFTSFNLEGGSRNFLGLNSSDPCPFDYIEIYDGPGNFDDVLGKFCGNSIPPSIAVTGNMMWINFVTDEINSFSGFRAQLNNRASPCGNSFVLNATTTTQVLTSPSFPEPYPHNIRCKWIIDGARPNDEVQIKFIDLNIETSQDCQKDRLEIRDLAQNYVSPEGMAGAVLYNGGTKMQVFSNWRFRNLGLNNSIFQDFAYCGTQIPPDFFSVGRTVEVYFQSDSFNSGRGFKIEYRSAVCNRTYEGIQGRILSPEWPTYSPIFSNCIMKINTPNNTFISLYFNQFFLQKSDACSDAVFEVKENNENGRVLARLCGSTIPDPIFSNVNSLWINYITRSRMNRGFDFSYMSSGTSSGCDGDLFGTGGTLSSPFYPGSPDRNLDCRWKLRVFADLKIKISFTSFLLGSDCEQNFMEIYSMNSHDFSADPLLFSRFCAGDNPGDYMGTTDMAMIRYKANVNNSGNGWILNFRGVLPSAIAA